MRKVDALVTFTDNRVANRVPFLIRDEDPLDYSRRTYKWLNNLPLGEFQKPNGNSIAINAELPDKADSGHLALAKRVNL